MSGAVPAAARETLENMLGCPQEHLRFPLWYLKQRGWIERLESGYLAITADGVDKLGSDDLALPKNRLIAETSLGHPPPDVTVRPGGPILLEQPRVPGATGETD